MNTSRMTAEILQLDGWTQARLATEIGVSQPTVARWQKGQDPEGPNRDKLKDLHRALVGPARPYSTFDPDVSVDPEFDPDGNSGAALVDNRVEFAGLIPGSAPETAAKAGMGPGQIDGVAARVKSNGIATGHPVLAEWVIPQSFLRHSLGGQPDTIIIVPVVGHSMEPRLLEGDRLIVDVSQNTWVADAMYVFDDGDVNLQVKTIKKVTSSFPAVYRIVSEADPADEVRLRADQFRIVGRVVGRISRP